MSARIEWPRMIAIAAELAEAEEVAYGSPPTLRRLHYLLVSNAEAYELGYRNTIGAYKTLSDKSARAREAGIFPSLEDRTRSVSYAAGFADARQAINAVARRYSLDRSRLMPVNVLVLVEKDGVMPLVDSRFDWLDTAAVRGYPSLTFTDSLNAIADRDERETVAIFASDYDPSGLDLARVLAERLNFEVRRVALTLAQVHEHDLPPMPAKTTDSRLARMVAIEGEAVQVEMDAMPAEALLRLIAEAITDVSGVAIRSDGRPDLPGVDEREAAERTALRELATTWQVIA